MPKVLFHYSVFNRGGAEKSTLRLIKLFLKNGWKVKLVLNFKGGSMEEEIPEDVEVDYLSCFDIKWYQNFAAHIILRAFDYLRRPFLLQKYKRQHYNLACIGLQGLNPRFVCKWVNADDKIIFIRSDLTKVPTQNAIIENITKYNKCLNKIICVSKTASDSVNKLLPQVHNKTIVVYNVIDADEMRRKASCSPDPFVESGYLKVVTVCRMVDHAKGLMRMLDAFERLYNQGVVFEWYFVGDGVDLPKMKNKVKNSPYEYLIHFEGEKENPFPYYKYSDLVAVLSYYEGLCGIVNEAKISGAAVIATEFSGIHEQIIHGKNGWIVENDLDSIVSGLKYLLTNNSTRRKIKNSILNEEILNDKGKINRIVSKIS